MLINEQAAELETMAQERTVPQRVHAQLTAAQQALAEARIALAANNVEQARIKLAEARHTFLAARFAARNDLTLDVREHIDAEESTVEEFRALVAAHIDNAQGRLVTREGRCANVSALIQSAAELHEQARAELDAGNEMAAAQLLVDARGTTHIAMHTAALCARTDIVGARIAAIVEAQQDAIEEEHGVAVSAGAEAGASGSIDGSAAGANVTGGADAGAGGSVSGSSGSVVGNASGSVSGGAAATY